MDIFKNLIPVTFTCSTFDHVVVSETCSFSVVVNYEYVSSLVHISYEEALRESLLEYFDRTVFVRDGSPLFDAFNDLNYKVRTSGDLNITRFLTSVIEHIFTHVQEHWYSVPEFTATVTVNNEHSTERKYIRP